MRRNRKFSHLLALDMVKSICFPIEVMVPSLPDEHAQADRQGSPSSNDLRLSAWSSKSVSRRSEAHHHGKQRVLGRCR